MHESYEHRSASEGPRLRGLWRANPGPAGEMAWPAAAILYDGVPAGVLGGGVPGGEGGGES